MASLGERNHFFIDIGRALRLVTVEEVFSPVFDDGQNCRVYGTAFPHRSDDVFQAATLFEWDEAADTIHDDRQLVQPTVGSMQPRQDSHPCREAMGFCASTLPVM